MFFELVVCKDIASQIQSIGFYLTMVISLFLCKARDVRTNEVVAIKKMSYSGKQSTEVS